MGNNKFYIKHNYNSFGLCYCHCIQKHLHKLKDFLLKKFYLNNVQQIQHNESCMQNIFYDEKLLPFLVVACVPKCMEHLCFHIFSIHVLTLELTKCLWMLTRIFFPLNQLRHDKELEGSQIIILRIVHHPNQTHTHTHTHIDIQTNNFFKTLFNNFNIKTSIRKNNNTPTTQPSPNINNYPHTFSQNNFIHLVKHKLL